MNDFYKIDYMGSSFDTKPKRLLDWTLLELLMRRPDLLVDIHTIRTCNDKAVVEKAKRRLPSVVWGGSFNGQPRRDENVESSGLFCQDIDHIADNPDEARQYYKEHFAGREDELGIVFAHVSPSGTGLHVVALIPEGKLSIAEAQQWLAVNTCSAYDPVCKNIGRIFYLSTFEDIIYNDLQS